MGIGKNLGESFDYALDAIVGKWVRWLILIICAVIFPLLYGYTLRIMKGTTPAPEVEGYLSLFIDGIKMMIISLVYMIIPLIILFLSGGSAALGMVAGEGTEAMALLGTAVGGLILFFIVAFIFTLITTIAMVRFARTGAMGEAFNFGEIFGTIGRVGWINYILALIVLWVIVGVIEMVVVWIPVLGGIVLFIVTPILAIFSARYISLLYDEGAA